jgi:hypothetical protein
MKYKIVGWDSGTGVLTVEAKCATVPVGTRFTVGLYDQGGKFAKDGARDATTAEGIRQIIEAALPVAWFEQLLKAQAEPPDDAHVRALAVLPPFECDREPGTQGVIRPLRVKVF